MNFLGKLKRGVIPVLALIGVLSLSLMCKTVSGQTVNAELSGTVTDQTQAVIPHANVSIKDTATGVVRVVVANQDGYYVAQELQPGPYEITVSAPGFTTRVQSDVNLDVGANIVLNAILQVGQASQTVQVTTQAPTINLTSSTISDQVEGPAIRELPLNGRDWTSLAELEPGVSSLGSTQYGYTQNGQNRTARGYGNQLTIAGALPFANVYRVDGIVVDDYANNVPGNALGVSLGVDAIEEFTVLTTDVSAAYGRTSGGVINAITRSGTNEFHGTTYEFLRNSALDARNYFDPPAIPPLRRNQYGASAGLPIIKDKTFLFADYEGLQQYTGITNIVIVPSAAAKAGHLCSIPTGVTPNCTPTTVTVDPAVVPYLPLWDPVNDGLLGNGDTGNLLFVSPQNIGGNYGIIRVDHHFSEKDTFFASYVDDTSTYTQPDNLDDVQELQTTANKRITLAETHIFGNGFVNSFRVGFNRVNAFGGGGTVAINPVAGEPSLGTVGLINPQGDPVGGQADAPGISATGIAGFGGGLADQPYNTFVWNSFQGYDDLLRVIGRHSVSFGGGVEHDQDAKVTYVSGSGGFSYSSWANFLENAAPTSYSVAVVPPSATKRYHVSLYSAYVNDDYKIRKNLTLNLGVHYEMETVPTEANNLIAILPSISATAPTLGGPMFENPSTKDFAPRVGFAWDPFGDGKTSIRSEF